MTRHYNISNETPLGIAAHTHVDDESLPNAFYGPRHRMLQKAQACMRPTQQQLMECRRLSGTISSEHGSAIIISNNIIQRRCSDDRYVSEGVRGLETTVELNGQIRLTIYELYLIEYRVIVTAFMPYIENEAILQAMVGRQIGELMRLPERYRGYEAMTVRDIGSFHDTYRSRTLLWGGFHGWQPGAKAIELEATPDN